MSDADTITAPEQTAADRDRSITAARSEAARLMASANRGKPRRRPSESLSVVVPIDCRTHAGKAAQALRIALLSQIGPKPAPAKLALVQQLIQLKLRLVMLDQNFLAAGGVQSAHEAAQYLSWSNSYVRGLKALGLDAIGDAVMSLADALAAGAHAAPPAAPAARAGAQAAGVGMTAHGAATGPAAAATIAAPQPSGPTDAEAAA